MDIFTFKLQFEQIVQPAPPHSLISAEQAWSYFKTSVKERIDDAYCEEFGFSASVASSFDGTCMHSDENLFQVYFGRMVDAEKGIYPLSGMPGFRQLGDYISKNCPKKNGGMPWNRCTTI
jgi:hypothetical protein